MSSHDEAIRTPDRRLRVFVSSTLGELVAERRAVRAAIERLHLAPVMFEGGARPHPPRDLYRSYLRQSDVFVALYGERYGWIAPGEDVSGLEDELRLSAGMPRLVYLRRDARPEPRLAAMIAGIEAAGEVSYRLYDGPEDLAAGVEEDLAALLSERFALSVRAETGRPDLPAPPVPLTATIGRDEDIARIVTMLTSGVRLLTLTGPGGVGKSRLALEVAARVHDSFPDGVVLVPLEGLTDAGLVLRSVVAAVRARDPGGRPVLDVLAEELRHRRVLLVMDNFEHVLAAAPGLAELLGRCPRVAALVTSRQPLHLRGEQDQPVAPLGVPGEGEPVGAAESTAVRLFVQRATAVHPGFRLDDDAEAVAGLVRLLDGLPLAIELAAARVRLLPPAALLDRLTERFDLSAGGASDLPSRQRTLRSTLDWSHQLLAPAEQVLFARLSVFAGGACLDAVEGVCGDDDVPDVLATASSLVDQNLVDVTTPPDGGPRVRMLNTVRTYAHERLAARGETAGLARRHAEWFARFAEPGEVLRRDDGFRRWPRFEPEIDNFRVAVAHALQLADPVLLGRFARGLWQWMWASGRVGEMRDASVRAVAAVPPHAAARDLGCLYYVDSYARGLTGDFAGGLRSADRAVALLSDDEDALRADTDLLVAAARLARGTLRLATGHPAGAAADYDRAVEVGRRDGSGWLLGYATSHRGLRRAVRGDLDGARADHEESLAVARALGFEVLVGQAEGQLALVEVLAGRPAAALDRLSEQLHHLRQRPNPEGLANALDTAAAIAAAYEQWPGAAQAAAAAEDLRRRTGVSPWPLLADLREDVAARARERLPTDGHGLAAGSDPWGVVEDVLSEVRARL